MPATHTRLDSVEEAPSAKKQKTTHEATPLDDLAACFATGLLDASNIDNLNTSYKTSEPYLYAVVDKLFQDDLLLKVKDECINELSFTEKETDIYKVHQTGDLASLSYLSEEQLKLLPTLLKLRDALYSPTFRDFIRKVTGCGPLSGTKQDMSVNSYKKGCHLLNHDDVIGTRRVSYILYMPIPPSEEWRPEWGGALELYPVKIGADGTEEPLTVPSNIIPPSWNQFVFFEVQPGHSFHSVEEVVVDDGGCDRQRLSISGWFHKAQEGEEGYEGEEAEKPKSSLEQLTTTSTIFTPYPDTDELLKKIPTGADFSLPLKLSADHISYLSSFLEPVYLKMTSIKALSSQFAAESSLQLHKFLAEPIAKKLELGLQDCDKRDGLDGGSRKGRIPPHTAGASAEEGGNGPWTIKGPPHKLRYCALSSGSSNPSLTSQEAIALLSLPSTSTEQILNVLQNHLFPSEAFRAWLTLIVCLFPLKYTVEARRFRPGLDYTLATSNNEESVLDVVLSLTPEAEETKRMHLEKDKISNGKGKAKAKKQEEEAEDEEGEATGWEKGEWGGWECYMAPHEGEEDPAVYRSGPSKSKTTPKDSSSNGKDDHENNGASPTENENVEDNDDDMGSDGFISDAGSDTDDADGTLLTVQAGFNRLLLVLRDESVMRFVKYVSASAPGSRWDVCCEYEVYMAQEDSEED